MTFVLSVDEVIADDKSGLLAKHESWVRVRLSEVANVLNGFPFDSSRFSSTQGTPLLRIRDIIRGWTETYYVGEPPDGYAIARGDLLIGMDGDFHCSRWKGEPALLNQRVCKVTSCGTGFDPVLLSYVLPAYLAKINAATPSVTVKHLSSRTIQEINLPLPPIAEQRRIGGKLDELFSDLDAGVAALHRAQANLKRYRASVLKAAVEGRLTAEWRQANPPTETGAGLLDRLLRERRERWEAAQLTKFEASGKTPPKGWREKYVEPTAPDTSKLPALPEGWCWASVDQLLESELANGRSVVTSDTGFPVLRLTAVRDGLIDTTASKIGAWTRDQALPFVVCAGDFLIARGNGSLHLVGRGGLVSGVSEEVAFPDTMIRARFCEALHPQLVRVLWDSQHVRRQIETAARTSAGIYKVAQGDLQQLVMPVPPMTEQVEVIRLVDAQFSSIASTERDLESSAHRARALRQAILKHAFAGKLVPQDPDDEPASQLLERIRAARAATPAATRSRGRRAKSSSAEGTATVAKRRNHGNG